MTTITVCTPWLDTPELQPAYWRAIEAGVLEGDRVLIVDNGSNPPFYHSYLERTGHGLPDYATVLRSSGNLGFSRACNAAFPRIGTDAVLWLNSDIRMTDPLWLSRIRSALKPDVLVGAKLRSDPHTAVDGRIVPYLDGWCLAAMVSTWNQLGWDDLEEPSYYGDNLVSVRAQAQGIGLVEVPVGLTHIENFTSRRMRYEDVAERNRQRYVEEVRRLRLAA